MSALAIILIVLGAAVLLLLIGGFVATRRRGRLGAADYERHLAEADRALEQARAADKGWDRALLEEAARKAVAEARPGFGVERLDLILVDDRPGVTEDRAHFLAAGRDGEMRVIVARHESGWVGERIE